MKVRKNLEAVFLAAAVLATLTSYATASIPAAQPAKAAVVAEAKMQVVTITHKRLTAVEKAQLG